MGELRIKLELEPGVYHITARVIHRSFLIGQVQRETLVRSMHRAAAFSGVEVITYCILENHFHILVRIDPRGREAGDAELVRRYRALYGDTRATWSGLDASGLEHVLKAGPLDEAERLRARLRRRMGDLSEFMRTLRQRYTRWYNRTTGAVGTLWAERFGSVLIEDSPSVVALVAAYIDLNPVRAGIVEKPEDYRWCGYTEALSGSGRMQASLAACFPGLDTKRALARYRILMLGKGASGKADGTGARSSPEHLLDALERKGELEVSQLIRLKVRYFTEGLVFGSRAWMEQSGILTKLPRVKRARCPKPIEAVSDWDLAVAKQCRGKAITKPGA